MKKKLKEDILKMQPETFEIKTMVLAQLRVTQSYLFCELEPHAKFQNPRTTPSGEKLTVAEREKTQCMQAAQTNYPLYWHVKYSILYVILTFKLFS